MHRLLVAVPALGLLLASAVRAQAPARALVIPERVVASADSIAHTGGAAADSDATVFPRVVSWAVAAGVARTGDEWPYREAPPATAGAPDDSVVSSTSTPAAALWPYRIDRSVVAAGQLAAGTIPRAAGYAAYWRPYHHHYHYYGCGCSWANHRTSRRYSSFAARYSLGFVPPWSTAGMAVP